MLSSKFSLPIMIACVLVLALLVAHQWHARIEDAYENVTYALDPSPALAFAYGERHFDATDPADYDIGRAEYFFELAAAKDPTIPYLYHELARISFLHGNYDLALAQIDFQISMHGDSEPNSYYMRALIEGYMGDYADAATDYQYFLKFDPKDWAGINDYSWVLLKAGRAQDAVTATDYGLKYSPNNPWLLNTNAIALYEVGLFGPAVAQARAAVAASENLTQAQWLRAYPGNDPKVAAEGIAAFQKAAIENLQTATLAASTSEAQSTPGNTDLNETQ